MPQYVLGQFIAFLAEALNMLLTLYMWIVIIGALLSWVSPDPRNPIVRFLYAVTEPVLWAVRRRLPFVQTGGIDLSPLVVILGIMLARFVVVRPLYRLAAEIIATAALVPALG
jgi:YggT family protein